MEPSFGCPQVSASRFIRPTERAAVELIRHADTAMYQAKARGRGLAVRFDPEMDRSQHERSMIERDLRRALGNHEFEVWFQPRFETSGLRITGFEALARWRHPEWGFISPARFIPVAEQCGLIAELGLRVLNDACGFRCQPAGRPHRGEFVSGAVPVGQPRGPDSRRAGGTPSFNPHGWNWRSPRAC